jgi:ADP-ribosylarginine hydrolase
MRLVWCYQELVMLWGIRTDTGITYSGTEIHRQLDKLTNGSGVTALRIDQQFSLVSDDTIMSIATAKALVKADHRNIGHDLADEYVKCWERMDGRAPGNTTAASINFLRNNGIGKAWDKVKFNARAGGCGAAMRAHPIGLRYHKGDQLDLLVAVSIESGRITHHSPNGYLGALVSALFTALAFRQVEPEKWGFILMDKAIPKAKQYIKESNRYVEENLDNFEYFESLWNAYLKSRNIADGIGPVKFPQVYGVEERDLAYKSWSYNGWGGSSGTDAPLIAYDAFLGCNGNWEELCLRGMLHGGDSDSTGAICAAFYGAFYGYKDVPELNHAYVELRDELVMLADDLYKIV